VETGTGIVLGLGLVAAAVFIARQMAAGTQAQIAALQAKANQGASLGDYATVGATVAKLV
jgi:hypothetical protein